MCFWVEIEFQGKKYATKMVSTTQFECLYFVGQYHLLVIAAQTIANIVKSSLGPLGLDKMLVDNIGVSLGHIYLSIHFTNSDLGSYDIQRWCNYSEYA